ncbi:hypothetical protein I4F81_006624 [Pyropia yezoensis]|uniref:Uncharacterized protein n=1 Tax=Pyropia yezoensis TaxID=2788 RepID=A0ACC3C1R5_PYRYE|nr:hypothetical protein I4F81_006624 [Neopyropia yezoensis]
MNPILLAGHARSGNARVPPEGQVAGQDGNTGEGARIPDPVPGHVDGAPEALHDAPPGGDIGGATSDPSLAGPGESPIALFKVVPVNSKVWTHSARPCIHACLGRFVYILWAKPADEVPTTVKAFQSRRPWCVRLERGAGVLRLAQADDELPAGIVHTERLLILKGKRRRSTPGIEELSHVALLLEASSAAVAAAWAAAGESLLCPWPALLSPLVMRDGDAVAAVQALQSSVLSRYFSLSRGDAVSGDGATGHNSCRHRYRRVAAHWLLALPNAAARTAMRMGDAVDQVNGVPVVGPALCLALFVAQVGALFVLAGERDAVRAAVTDRCADVLIAAVGCTAKALSCPQADWVDALTQPLCDVLHRTEALLGEVEASYFESAIRSAVTGPDEVVRGWEADLDVIHRDLLALVKTNECTYAVMERFAALSENVADGFAALSETVAERNGRVEPSEATTVEDLDARLDVRAPDLGYVPGVSKPDRVEHALFGTLRNYVHRRGRGGMAPRVGVTGIGGSGKTTSCAGVAICEEVRDLFPRGSVWVQLGDASSRQTLVDAVVGLTARFCGHDVARRLLSIPPGGDVVSIAAGHVQSASADDSAEWLVVIDDVLVTKVDLLRQLLRVVPLATPILFTTRSEAVASAVGSESVPIDGLPDADCRLLLANAMSRDVRMKGNPFSASEENDWVRPVVEKTGRHALSLNIIGSMIGRRGAWRRVAHALKERWMEPDFVRPDGGLGLRPSVRATLDTSLGLLPDEASRMAFRALGILPASVEVGVDVLLRLWRPLLDTGAVADVPVADRVRNADCVHVRRIVGAMVDSLIDAGLVRSVGRGTEVSAIILHPVVAGYAKCLLGSSFRDTHSRLLNDYVESTSSGEAVGGVVLYKLEKLPDDDYIFDNVARHAQASGNVGVLVSLTQSGWPAFRERKGLPQAYQEDLEIVVAALLAVVGDVAHEVHQHPGKLAGVRVSLGRAYLDRVGGSRKANVEAAVECYLLALRVWTRETTPRDWAFSHINLGIAYSNLEEGDRARNVEAAIGCYHKALLVLTREAAPLEWAVTQINLGVAYFDRVVGDKADNMEAALKFYQLALLEGTREVAPRDWALTQNNLGQAYMDRVVGDRATNVDDAVKCYRLALEVLTREEAPRFWAMIQDNLGIAYRSADA